MGLYSSRVWGSGCSRIGTSPVWQAWPTQAGKSRTLMACGDAGLEIVASPLPPAWQNKAFHPTGSASDLKIHTLQQACFQLSQNVFRILRLGCLAGFGVARSHNGLSLTPKQF